MATRRRLLIFYALSKRFQATPRQESYWEGRIGSKPLESFERKNAQQSFLQVSLQEMKNRLPDIASGFNRGNRIRTNLKNPGKTGLFAIDENSTAYFTTYQNFLEHVLSVFDRLTAGQQEALIVALQDRITSPDPAADN